MNRKRKKKGLGNPEEKALKKVGRMKN